MSGPSPRERAVMDEVLDRINGCPPIYMPELDDDPVGPGMSDGDDVRNPDNGPPANGAS